MVKSVGYTIINIWKANIICVLLLGENCCSIRIPFIQVQIKFLPNEFHNWYKIQNSTQAQHVWCGKFIQVLRYHSIKGVNILVVNRRHHDCSSSSSITNLRLLVAPHLYPFAKNQRGFLVHLWHRFQCRRLINSIWYTDNTARWSTDVSSVRSLFAVRSDRCRDVYDENSINRPAYRAYRALSNGTKVPFRVKCLQKQ